jgi:hypothetical protein
MKLVGRALQSSLRSALRKQPPAPAAPPATVWDWYDAYVDAMRSALKLQAHQITQMFDVSPASLALRYQAA